MILGTLLLSFILRIVALEYRYFNEDEIEHLHVAYLISSGEIPYVDFFEHHLPVFHYLVSLMVQIIENPKNMIFLMRTLMFICVIFIFFITYKIGGKLFNKNTALLSLFFLASNILFFEKSLEIRPDVPQTLLWVISFYTLIMGFRKKSYYCMSISGLLLGFAFTLTQKTVYVLAPVLLTFFVWCIFKTKIYDFMKRIKLFFLYLIAFSIPVAILFLYFYSIGAFKVFFDWNFVKATIWDREIYPWDYMIRTMRQNSPFWVFGLGYSLFHFLRKFKNWKNQPEELLMPLSVFLLIVALLLTSGPYRQTYMPILPIVAIFAGRCFDRGINFLRGLKGGHSLSIPFILILFFAFTIPPFGEIAGETKVDNQKQLNLIDFIHNITEPEDSVFDGLGYGIYRPSAFYFHMLSAGVINMMGRENREEKIIESIIDNNTKVMVYDYRVKNYLPDATKNFLLENFVPVGFLGVFVTGKDLDRDFLVNSNGFFNLISDGYYKVVVNGIENKISVDGNMLEKNNSIYLKKGNHKIAISGFYDNVVIRFDFEKNYVLNFR